MRRPLVTCPTSGTSFRSPRAPREPGRRPRHFHTGPRLLWAIIGVACCLVLGAGMLGAAPGPRTLVQLLDDPPEVIPYAQALTDEQRDRAEAVARYTHGRVLLQRASQLENEQQAAVLAEALRCMQRAWWHDPQLVSIMEDIFPLALALNRSGEAARYAILAASEQDVPAELLERVALLLAEQEQADRALQMYRQFVARQEGPLTVWSQFELGRLALLAGQFEEAATALALVRDALTEQGEATLSSEERTRLLRNATATYTLLGEAFLRAKRSDEAEDMFRRADQAKPNPAMLGYQLALVEHQRGQRDQALHALQTYFDAKITTAQLLPYRLLEELLDGPRTEPQASAADATAQRQPSATLLDRLRELAAQDAQNVFLGYFLADRLRAAAQWEEAESRYRSMLQLEATADGHQGLVEIYLHQERLEPLLRELGEVVGQTGSLAALDTTIDPLWQNPDLLARLTELAESEAADDAADVTRGSLMAVALLQARAGHGERAGVLFDRIRQAPSRVAGTFALSLAFQLLERREPARGAAILQRVLDDKLLPEQVAELHFSLAGAWAAARDFERALAAAREAARLEPDAPRMLAREPWVLYLARRFEEAQTAYEALLARFDSQYESDTHREALRDVRFVLSAIHVEQQRLTDAEELLQQVLDEFPEDIGAFNDLGYLWCDQGKHLQRALVMIQRAVEAEPDNTAYRDSLGWVLYRLGRYPEALAELRIAAASESADGVILDHLGDVYLQMNELSQAREAWQRAAAAFATQDDAQRLADVHQKLAQHAVPPADEDQHAPDSGS